MYGITTHNPTCAKFTRGGW